MSPHDESQFLNRLWVHPSSQSLHSVQGVGQLCIVVGVGVVVGAGVGVGVGVGVAAKKIM